MGSLKADTPLTISVEGLGSVVVEGWPGGGLLKGQDLPLQQVTLIHCVTKVLLSCIDSGAKGQRFRVLFVPSRSGV